MTASEKDMASVREKKKRGRSPVPVECRLFARLVEQPDTGCLNWTGATNLKGYGRIRLQRMELTHRVAYELAKGPIPEGLLLDHLCRNPACCNPDHLEAVTLLENTRRGNSGRKDAVKTHCPAGHPYDEQNTYRSPAGHRHCRTCMYARQAAKRRAAQSLPSPPQGDCSSIAKSAGEGPDGPFASDSSCQSEGGGLSHDSRDFKRR